MARVPRAANGGAHRAPVEVRTLAKSKQHVGAGFKSTKKSIICIGGAKGSRTPDLLNAIQALSQLSYGPNPVMWALGPFI
jgi:hypothetical protein